MQEKSHVKELFSQTMIYGLGIILNKSVGFILLPVYTKYFSPEQIGLFALIQSVSFFLGVLYMFGMETSFMKFFIDAKDIYSKSKIYSSTLLLLAVTSFIFSAIIYFSSDYIVSLFRFSEINESIFLVKILALLMFVDTMSRFPLLLFRAELKSKTYAYINLFSFVINIICNIVFIVIFRKGIETIFYSYIISVVITFIIGLLLTKKYLILKVSVDILKQMLLFGNKFIYIGFFVLLIDISDRFFLKYFFDESIVGVYSANYRLASVMGFLIASFRFSWTPYFLNLSEVPENKKIISSIFTYFVFAGLMMFLVFSLLIPHLVKINIWGFEFLNINYWPGLKIVPVILLAYLFSGAYSILNAAPFFKNKTISILLITATGLLINTIFNFLLIPSFDISGAALSTLITYFIMFLIIYLYSQKIYKIKYQWNIVLKLAALTTVLFAISYFITDNLSIDKTLILIFDLFLITLFLLITNYSGLIELKKISILWKK